MLPDHPERIPDGVPAGRIPALAFNVGEVLGFRLRNGAPNQRLSLSFASR